MQKNFYVILGVQNTASSEEIKAAFRILAKKYHPDKNHGNKAAEEYFKEIQQAYAVLTNAEKRKKYDLKFSYSHTYPEQKQKAAYTNKSNSFAQPGTKKKHEHSANKPAKKKFDITESIQILFSVGIALSLLYFIISYSSKKSTPRQTAITQAPVVEKHETPAAINNFDSPYSSFFGEEVNDADSKNSITFHNSDESEVVICLVQSEKSNKTIRNQYLNRGATFKMNTIPDGNYFLKIYYGTNWNTKKTFLKNAVHGGFSNDIGFVKMNSGKDELKMKQGKIGNSVSFSSFEIELSPYQINREQTITAEDFFN